MKPSSFPTTIPSIDTVKALSLIQQFSPEQSAGIKAGLDLVFPDKAVLNSAESLLTRKGAPLEWAYVWPSNSLRFSADPSPGQSDAIRRDRCLQLCGPFNDPFQQKMIQTIIAWQKGSPCRYGAWMGVKNNGGLPQTKLYLEIPEEAPWQDKEAEWTCRSTLPGRPLQLTMIGLDPASKSYELYYRMPKLYPDEIGPLQRTFGCKDRGQGFLAALEKLGQRKYSLRAPIPSADIGCSVAYRANGSPEVFTLYCFAHSLLGGDQQIRKQVLNFNQHLAYESQLYKALSQPAANAPFSPVTWHGMVGLVAADQGPIHFTIGISSPNQQQT